MLDGSPMIRQASTAGVLSVITLVFSCGSPSAPSSHSMAGASAPEAGSSGTEAGGSGATGATKGSAAGANAVDTESGGANSESGGSVPAVVGDPVPPAKCSGLAAVGKWENITPPAHDEDYRSADFGVDSGGNVYLGTDSFNTPSRGVLRTTDCGKTWEQVSVGAHSDAINNGRQWTFAVNPKKANIIYTNSGYAAEGLYKSENSGRDWTDVTPRNEGSPASAGNLQMDPEDPDHLLLTFHAPCSGKNNEYQYEDQVGCFHETKNGGKDWTSHYGSPTWPAQVRVLLLHGDTWVVLGNETLYTKDGGKTYASVLDEGLGGHSSGTLSRARDGIFYIGTQNGIYRSLPGTDGSNWPPDSSGGAWVGEIAQSATALWATQQQSSLLTSSDGSTWTPVADSPQTCERAKYDPNNKIVYASCGASGFWRAVVD